MSYIVIIPARLKSTRLEEKLLQDVHGKPLIQYTYENAIKSQASRVFIATDSEKIEEICQNFGARTIKTSLNHKSGTSRISEAIEKLELKEKEIIVNLQGDEPMMHYENINQVANTLENSNCPMSSLFEVITDIKDYYDENCVKVVCNSNNQAMYFSRSPIPASRDKEIQLNSCYKHIGIYAYRKEFLKGLINFKQSKYEQLEKLEQLTFLFYGHNIQMNEAIKDSGIGIDTEHDLRRLKRLLA